MKGVTRFAIVGGLGIPFVCCLLTLLFLDGYYLPYKPCRPITYPDAKKTNAEFSHALNVSIDSVLPFFDHHLDIRTAPVERGQWQREEVTNSKYVYSCISVDINGLTGETGCIYVVKDEQNTRIHSKLLRWEGGSITCPTE